MVHISQLPMATLPVSRDALLALVQEGGTFRASLSEAIPQTYVNVWEFGTSAELEANAVPAFVAALATGYPVFVPAVFGFLYTFASALVVPTRSRLMSNGAQIALAAGVNNHVMRIANGADDVCIEGFKIDGNKAHNTGGHGIATGGTGATNLRIRDNYVENCAVAGIYTGGVTLTGIDIGGNYVTGCGAGGITGDDTNTKFNWHGNFCWLNGTHGVGLIGVGHDGAIVDNVCWDNGQGTPNADNLTGYNSLNSDLTITGNISSGGLNNGIHFSGQRIVYTGNVASGAAKYGISHYPNTGGADGLVMTGNISYDNGLSGFAVSDCNSGVITGNESRDNGQRGFVFDNCAVLTITGNTARGNALAGFENGQASAHLNVTGNTAMENGGDGIKLNNVTLSTVGSNTVNFNTGVGISGGGTEANNVVTGNNVRGNGGVGIAQLATTTRISGNETGESRTIASAATMTLLSGGEFFTISGTTNITSITASFAERRVTLKFSGILTVVDGGNLILAADFVTSANDTLTLICDGASWIECSRSVN